MGDGVPKDQIYPIDVARGLAALDKIKPELIWWESGGQSAQFLIDGESDVGSTWNGRVYQPKVDGAPVDYTFNDALFVSGAWCVVTGASNVGWSMEFIAHTLEPERQAIYSQNIPYGPVVPAALEYIPADRLPLLPSWAYRSKSTATDYASEKWKRRVANAANTRGCLSGNWRVSTMCR